MTPRGLILALKSPFSGPPTTGPRASALPPDLLREARRRLGVLARLLMAMALINLMLGHTLFPRLHVGWPVVADLVVVRHARPGLRSGRRGGRGHRRARLHFGG